MTGKKKRFKIGIIKKKQVEWGIGVDKESIEMKIRGVFDKYYELEDNKQ